MTTGLWVRELWEDLGDVCAIAELKKELAISLAWKAEQEDDVTQ